MTFCFIGGLGCNVYYPQDFFTALHLPVLYLDLYGQEIRRPSELEQWFGGQVDLTEDVTLLAHSMGADFAVYLASVFPSVKKLILLDGGFLDLEKICSLEEEITDAKLYLENTSYVSVDEAISSERKEAKHWSQNYAKAVKANLVFNKKAQAWKLGISQQIVKNLLTLRRLMYGRLSKLSDRQINLFIPKATEVAPNWKDQALKELPDYVQLIEVEDCGHNIYVDNPLGLAKMVRSVLD
ncbi:alpha/beta hydrolase [Streptococcus sanguinis]|uniref:alpha/beta hydrolase n=1 Tax=Streptococcus sanguinis TaxID=1305 RepID=UPI0022838C9D|nr:alpha/beta hydrolase [Streptococcus sanguinis]MCY7040244.1 alpha/beta hydrolase [Streptococcus sanguinis]